MDEGMRFEEVVSLIISEDPRYELKAYAFVYNVIGDLHAAMDVKRHLTGGEVLEGLRVRATDKFGPMAKEVLNTWGIEIGRASCRERVYCEV